MTMRTSVWVVSAVICAHAAALVSMSAQSIQPPQLHSAPPIYGSLVPPPAAPDSVPETRPQQPVPVVSKKVPAAQSAAPLTPLPSTSSDVVEEVVRDTDVEVTDVAVTDAEVIEQPTVIPPRIDASGRDNPPPAYPSASRRAKEQGRVMLAIHIDERGRVTEARVHRSSGYRRLDQAALDAVRHWRYQPAQRSGRAIGFDYMQPVVFSLDQ